MAQTKLKDKPSLTLKRHYPVAPEKVWRAWTDPQAIAKWWGPGGTDLEFLHEQFFDEAARDGHKRGWTESLVKLERFLADEQPALTVTRVYPFAPEKLWRAWTDPQALGQWFRPDASFSIPLAEADVRVGGRFRVLMTDAKGEEFDLSGVYREVVPARKLVMTWSWKNQPGHESLVTVSLRPSNGGTLLELRHEDYLDFENQPTHEQGWNGALDKLEQLLGETHGLR